MCARQTLRDQCAHRSQNESVILLAGWLWQATAQSRRVFPDDAEGAPVNVSRAFLQSGAQGLLAPWRVPRAGACKT